MQRSWRCYFLQNTTTIVVHALLITLIVTVLIAVISMGEVMEFLWSKLVNMYKWRCPGVKIADNTA